jgi:uncharacterized protein YfaP (DUF2135 family)
VNPTHLLQEAPTYPTGVNPVAAAIGDFNGDGNEDLVTANFSGNNISVLLGNGDGTFRLPVDYATQVAPTSVAVGDFNGDGKLDLAVTNLCGGDKSCESRGTVSILLGNGDGTFQPRKDYPVGAYRPVSVAVGDFNGDHKLDLAIANLCGNDPTCQSGPNNVSILLGNGDGTFQKPQKFGTGSNPSSVAVADFNGDGKLDLAVANNIDSTVSILLGNGDGTFQHRVNYPTGTAPSSIAVGDLNGDGKADLAVADSGLGNVQGSAVSILLGNGDGTFRRHVDYATGNNPLSVVVADLKGDSKQDLILANNLGDTVSVLLGNGDGTFKPRSDYGTQSGPSAALVGSFHGSDSEDVVATNSNVNTVSVLLGNGTGTFPTRQDFATAYAPWSLTTGDFRGDGKADIVATVFVGTFGDVVSVLLGNGNGTFQPHVDYATGAYPYAVVVGDFNHDDKADLATANEQGASVSILLGNGDGTFQPHMDYPTGGTPYSIAAGDFNGDGKLDLVTAIAYPDAVAVLLGNGDGTFQPPVSYAAEGEPDSVAVGDFNGDHKLDLAVANYCGSDPHCQSAGSVSIFLGNGDGTFQPQVPYNTEFKPTSVVTADLNNDGKLDLAVANAQSNTVSILLGNGDGTFQPQVSYATGTAPYSIAVGDFNGDGKPDVATANCGAFNCAPPSNAGTVSLLIGNGDGTFQPHVDFSVGSETRSIAVADFNGDGKTDLATVNNQSATVSVLLNTTGTTIALTSSLNPSTKGQSVTFSATVRGTLQGEPNPKGTVRFNVGSGRQEARLIHGVANFKTSMLPVGKTRVTAHYSGDGAFNPNTSGRLIQVVHP